MQDSGIIEEIRLGSIKTHDLELSREMVLNSKHLKHGDIIINDRGFISRELMNELKKEKGVDTYVPLKKNVEAYEQAVSIAKEENKWREHPNRKRKGQKIAFAKILGCYWRSERPEEDVEINGCIIRDEKKDEYFVFVTTDLEKTARQIINTYELRPEIEEDYRQIKDFWKIDFWKIEDFKSTKYNFIAFHIVMVLIGYMYFQLYTCMEEGRKYAKKVLPVAMKKYTENKPKSVIIYSQDNTLLYLDFLNLFSCYASCNADVKKRLDRILAEV